MYFGDEAMVWCGAGSGARVKAHVVWQTLLGKLTVSVCAPENSNPGRNYFCQARIRKAAQPIERLQALQTLRFALASRRHRELVESVRLWGRTIGFEREKLR
jgi:hypothetical protein